MGTGRLYVMDGRAASCASLAGCVSVWHQRKGYTLARRQPCQLVVQDVVGDVDSQNRANEA